MKKFLIVLTSLVIFIFMLSNVYALKVGYVDIEKVFNQYSGTKKAKTKLQSKLEEEQKRIDKKKQEILKMKDDLDKQKSILDKNKLKEKEDELQQKLEKLQADALEIQQKLYGEEKELTANIVEEIRAIVQKIAKDKGYDFVFEKNLLLYGGEDITYLVLKQINEE